MIVVTEEERKALKQAKADLKQLVEHSNEPNSGIFRRSSDSAITLTELMKGAENYSMFLGAGKWSCLLYRIDVSGREGVSLSSGTNQQYSVMVKSIQKTGLSQDPIVEQLAQEECIALEMLTEKEGHSGVLAFSLYISTGFSHMVSLCASGDLFELSCKIYSKEKKWDDEHFAKEMLAVKEGIDWLGTQKLVHRDVKLVNILYFEKDDVIRFKLTDFGTLTDFKKAEAATIPRGTDGYLPPAGTPVNQVDFWCWLIAARDFSCLSSASDIDHEIDKQNKRSKFFNPEELKKVICVSPTDRPHPLFFNMLQESIKQQETQGVPESTRTNSSSSSTKHAAAELSAQAPAAVDIKDTQTLNRSALVMGLLVIGLMVAMAVTAGVGLLGAACVLAGVAAVTAGPAAQLAAECSVTVKPSLP